MGRLTERLSAEHERFLTDLFPGDECTLSKACRAVHGVDSSRLSGDVLAVVRPRTEEQVAEVLRFAEAERIAVMPRARGTGTVGGCVPAVPGIVISLLGMNRILDLDPDDFVAEVEPGVITGDLQREAAKLHMLYPPDPASSGFSTVGGNVATCAGGLRAVKYGVTRDYLLGLDAFLPGGRVLRLGGRSHKDVVGLDLKRLFCGSQGKLGVATRLVMKLVPKPEATASVLAGFSGMRSALEGAASLFRAGILPAACEFMDRATLSAIRQSDDLPLPAETGAALLLQVDGSEHAVKAETERMRQALDDSGPLSLLEGRGEDEAALWDVRRKISPASFNLRPDKMGEDIAVPRGRVPDAVEACHRIGDRFNLPIMCFGHLGDGNIHVNIMYNATWPEEAEAALAAKVEVFRLALSLGGTISGEHGTGLTKKDFVPEQLGEFERAVMQDVKAVFDPSGIMNPGKGW